MQESLKAIMDSLEKAEPQWKPTLELRWLVLQDDGTRVLQQKYERIEGDLVKAIFEPECIALHEQWRNVPWVAEDE